MVDVHAHKTRWEYRFENYQRAFLLLQEAINTLNSRGLSQLEKEGVIQRFEYCWELAWKLIKDIGEAKGLVFETITPLQVIKTAYQARIIAHGDSWLAALKARNLMAHTYNFAEFERIIAQINHEFLAIFDELYRECLRMNAKREIL